MKINRAAVRSIKFAGAVILVCSGVAGAFGAVQTGAVEAGQPLTFEVVKTNWVQRAHTNVIEVQMPRVVVVNEFRTNWTSKITTNTIEVSRTQWVDQFTTNVTYSLRTNWTTKLQTNTVTLDRYNTNVVDFVKTNVITAYATNPVTRFTTNTLVVDQYRTNRVDAYTTNLLTRIQTNMLVVDAYITNLVTRTHTNTFVVEQVRTNRLFAYHTNLAILNVTNWETVLVMKTNWIAQPVTNVVAINLPVGSTLQAATPPAIEAAEVKKETKMETVSNPMPGDTKDLAFEWTRSDDNKAEIVLTLKSVNNSSTILQAQEWRVQRSDATILLMGKGVEFRGELPPGTYNVTVKARRGEGGPLLNLRGSIKVTADANTHQVLVATVAQRN